MPQTKTPHRKTVLITGASAGIGYHLARVFAGEGYDNVLVARNGNRLEETAIELEKEFGVRTMVVTRDLTDRTAPDDIFGQLEDAGVRLQVLVNNAGFGLNGPFHETDLQRQLDMIQVNLTALVHLTHRVLPGMVQRGLGRILNVASTAAFQPGPLMSIYYATKAFVVSFSEAIAYELRNTGVTVTAFCPGPTRTEFQARAGMEHAKIAGTSMLMDAQTVARAGYQALMDGKRVFIPGVKNRILAFGASHTPNRIVTPVVASMNSGRKRPDPGKQGRER